MKKTKYYKWYNLAREVIQNEELIPNREPFVSSKDWLMFAPASVNSMEEAKNESLPNVFFDLSRDLKEGYGRLGLTFNTIEAVEKLRNILSNCCKEERDELTNALLSLESVWMVKVFRKIKYKNHSEPPTYIPEFNQVTNRINEEIIKNIFQVSDRIREEGKQNREREKEKQGKSRVAYQEVPSIDLMESVFELTEENFKSRIKEVFNILAICLKVKSTKEIKTITKEKNEQLEQLKEEQQKIISQLKKKDFFLKQGGVSPQEIAKKEQRLKEIEMMLDEKN